MTDDLLPCPFCGAAAEMTVVRSIGEPHEKSVHCTNDDCRVSQPFASGDYAIAAWNRRQLLAQPADADSWPERCDWPKGKRFTVRDEPGEHDPCYLVMPGGGMIPFVHHATNGVDQARAEFIASACNSFIAYEADELLRNLGLDPERFRTEGGRINHYKVAAAIKHPADYDGLYLPAPGDSVRVPDLAQPAGSGGVVVPARHPSCGPQNEAGHASGDDYYDAGWNACIAEVERLNIAAPASPQGWLPIESAPNSGAFLMLCDGGKDSARVFFAEASFEGADGALVWHITTGWMGWSKLHSAWTPSHWQPLPSTSIALGGPTDLIGLAHNAISRALDEAGIKQPVHRGMCLEVGLQTFADGLPPSSGDGRGVG